MATRKYKPKHIAEATGTYVGEVGELILNTSTNTLKASDGSTAGGVTLNTDAGGVAEPDFTFKTASFSASSGIRYGIDTSSNVVTATLPASPSTGDSIFFSDAKGSFFTNNLTVARNSKNINGIAEDMTVSTNNSSFGVVYNGTGWRTYL